MAKYSVYIPSATGRQAPGGATYSPHPKKRRNATKVSPMPKPKPKKTATKRKARASAAPKRTSAPGSAKWERFFAGSGSIKDKRFR